MKYLTDEEHRLLLTALVKEKHVCEQIDKEYPDAPNPLTPIVKRLINKFSYNRLDRFIEDEAERIIAQQKQLGIRKRIEMDREQ